MKGHYVARVCLNVKLSEAIAGDATASSGTPAVWGSKALCRSASARGT
jgi:hypothetical protein